MATNQALVHRDVHSLAVVLDPAEPLLGLAVPLVMPESRWESHRALRDAEPGHESGHHHHENGH